MIKKIIVAVFVVCMSAFAGQSSFLFYGNGGVHYGLVQRSTDRLAAVTLPDALPADDVYLMWGLNEHGFGKPVGVNKAEAWWVGPDIAWSGMQISIYGANLDLGDGLGQAYIAESDQWIVPDAVNPYKMDITLPDGLTVGNTYTIYAHNGHGKKYGWSEPHTITIREPIAWNGTVFNVKDYGATGDGVTDDIDAILAARDAANAVDYSTLYFPAGTYMVSKSVYANKDFLRIKGDGMDQTIIQALPTYSNADDLNASIVQMRNDTAVEDLEVNIGDWDGGVCLSAMGIGDRKKFQYVNRVRLNTNSRGSLKGTGRAANLGTMKYAFLSDCEFIISGFEMAGSTESDIYLDGCDFIGTYDSNSMIARSNRRFHMINCSGRSKDSSDPNDGSGWAKGRFVSGGGTVGFSYFEGNTTSNMYPRNPTAEWSGEVLEVVTNTGSVTYSHGTFTTHDIRFAPDFDDVEFGQWPDSTLLMNPEGKAYGTVSMDYDTGWIRVWNRDPAYFDVGDICTMRESVDGNSGEQFMWESHTTLYEGSPAGLTDGKTFVLAGLSEDISQHVFCIAEGRGMGQHSEIESINASTGEIVLKKTLRVAPDETSLCKIGKYMHDMAFYLNNQNGSSDYLTENSATVGLSCFGGAFNINYVSNTVSEMETGVTLFTRPEIQGESPLQPGLFNYIADNVINSTDTGIDLRVYDFSVEWQATPSMNLYGNIIRNNSISNITGNGLQINSQNGDYRIDLNVYEQNSLSDCGGYVMDTENTFDQVFIGNEFTGSGSGTGLVFVGDSEPPVLRGNSWSAFDSAYGGDLPGAVLEVPVQVYFVTNSTQTVTLYNSGTANAAWSNPLGDTGTILPDGSDSFSFSSSSPTSIDVVSGGQTNTISVID